MNIRTALSFVALVLLLPLLVQAQTTARRPLIENVTGTWCQYCPFGADSIRSIKLRTPEAIAVSYHNQDPMATAEGNQIDDSLAVQGYPNAAVDRTVWNIGGTLYLSLSRGYWGATTSIRAAVPSPMQITMAGNYDSTSRLLTATVDMKALQDMTGTYVLYFMVLEDSLNYPQVKNGVGTISPYYHFDVVRKVVTGGTGKTVTTMGFTANQTIQENVQWTLGATWNPRKCKVVAFVVRNYGVTYGQRDVQQAIEEPLYNNSAVFNLMPVNLQAFSGSSIESGVRLSWTALSETNNRGWNVERSSDGEPWHAVSFVDGRGSSTERHTYEFVDATVSTGRSYFYRLRQMDFDGTEEMSNTIMVVHGSRPATMRIAGIAPNPFTTVAAINVDIAEAGQLRLQVFDAMGRLVRTLADGDYAAGTHSFSWKGLDASGVAMPNGTYFCRLSTTAGVETQQLMLVR